NFVELALPPFSVIKNGFVANVPSVNTTSVAGNNGMDMIPHAFYKHVSGNIMSVLIHEKPLRSLRMPNERMPDDFQAVFFSEFNEAIGLSEIKFTFLGLQIHAFHGIFSDDRIKMLFNNFDGLRV